MEVAAQMSMRLPTERKEVDDVLAEETKWEHAQRTQGVLLARHHA